MNVDGGVKTEGATTTHEDAGGNDAMIPKNSLHPDLPRAAELLFGNSTEEKKLYWDRSHYDSPDSQMKALTKSSTLYIGNLGFSARSVQLRSHFSLIGPIKAVHMGLDRFMKTPCGFGFVEYFERRDALEAVASLSGTKLDGRVIRAELDAGFQQGREFGRGASGGQVRDDRRRGMDPARSKRGPSGANRNQEASGGEPTSYYGGGSNTNPGEKREREDDSEMGGEDRPEKNPRFRED